MIDFAEIRSTTQARLKNILARVVFGGTTGTDEGAQMVPPLAADEGEEGAEVWQQWGFASRPLPASGVIEALVVAIEDGLAVLATRQQRTQVALAPGEAVLYCAATGCTVKLTATGRVEITAKSGQDVRITADGAGLVKMQNATQPFVCGTAYANALEVFLNASKVAMTAVGTCATALGPAVPITGPAAAVALNTAIGLFHSACDALKAARTTYLSTRIQGE